MPGSQHGPSIKDPDQYEALRDQGMSKEKAARISNRSANEGRSQVGERGGEAENYEDRTKDELPSTGLACRPGRHHAHDEGRTDRRAEVALTTYGFTLSSEEHLGGVVDLARRAESVGFEFLTVSDHFHPWVEAQGHSPFVWSLLGAIATVTDRIRVGRRRHVSDREDPPGDRGARRRRPARC